MAFLYLLAVMAAMSIVTSIHGIPHQLPILDDSTLEEQQLIISSRTTHNNDYLNPVDKLLNREPETVTEKFTQQLLSKMKLIRDHCEKMEAKVETEMDEKLVNLSLYQEYINDMINSHQYELSEQDEQKIKDGFAGAFEELFAEEQVKESNILLNCTQEFQDVMNDKMTNALQYAEQMLTKSPSEFALLIDNVMKYKTELLDALAKCMNEFPTHSTTDDPLMKGSSSYECKQVEIQILAQFVNELILRIATDMLPTTNKLPSAINDEHLLGEDNILIQIPEIFPRPEITLTTDHKETPAINPLPVDEEEVPAIINLLPATTNDKLPLPNDNTNQESTQKALENDKEKPHPDEKHQPNKELDDQTHHHHNHGDNKPSDGDHSNVPSDNTDVPSDNTNVPSDNTDVPSDNTDVPSDNTDVPSDNTDVPSDNTDAPSDETNEFHFDVHIIPPTDPTAVTDQSAAAAATIHHHSTAVVIKNHSFSVLLVCGIISGTLFVLILAVGVAIIAIKYYKYKTSSAWTHFTEEQKIKAMKQSGYINPTYEFFDKVTASPQY